MCGPGKALPKGLFGRVSGSLRSAFRPGGGPPNRPCAPLRSRAPLFAPPGGERQVTGPHKLANRPGTSGMRRRHPTGVMVDLRVLGPLELWQGGRRRALGSPKERAVLASLIHARGTPVSAGTLIERLWEDSPLPEKPLAVLRSYLARLRGRLWEAVENEAEVETVSSSSYRLRVAPGSVGLLRWERLRGQAREAASHDRPELAAELLRRAESLWRGEPLAEFRSTWAGVVRERLEEERRQAREERILLELDLGRHADLVGELREVVRHHPLAENSVSALMLALYRCGRQQEALALYRSTHRLFTEQGLAPGPALQELHLRMLDQDGGLLVGARSDPVERPRRPHTLPRDVPHFTGRAAELTLLGVAPDGSGASTSVSRALPVTLLHGMPGIGKTALAVHAAHRLTPHYPDAQLFLDLGSHGGRPPREPGEALGALLQAAGVTEPPEGVAERAGVWRQWARSRRLLLVLDDAAHAGQVEPLLPGTPDCRVIVTSRRRLHALGGALPLPVEALSDTESATLFHAVAGPSSGRHEADGVPAVLHASGRHPLAIQLLARHLRNRPGWTVRDLLDRLTPDGSDRHLDPHLTQVFELAFTQLTDGARSLLTVLARHPGTDLTPGAMASLTGLAPAALGAGTEELLDWHLVEEPARDRYRLHDLTRGFASAMPLPEHRRRAALNRLFDHYLYGALDAIATTHPGVPLPPAPGAADGVRPPEFRDDDEAAVWLAVERANLLAVARTSVATSPPHAALFPQVLAPLLETWAMLSSADNLFEAAIRVLRAGQDDVALARALTAHAGTLVQRSHREALSRADEALALLRRHHHPRDHADALYQRGRALLAAGDRPGALHQLEEAVEAYRSCGEGYGEAESLNVIGVALHGGGHPRLAYQLFLRHLRAHRALGNEYRQMKAWNNLGECHRTQGQHQKARLRFERSLALARRVGGRQDRVMLHSNLAAVCLESGDTAAAFAYFRRALAACQEESDPRGQADALNGMAAACLTAGRAEDALRHYREAERLTAAIDNPHERQDTLVGLGSVHLGRGAVREARNAYEEALRLAVMTDAPRGIARAREGLARCADLAEEAAEALAQGGEALALFEQLGHTAEAEVLRSFLTRPGGPGSRASARDLGTQRF
ncbi:AfsR/SARP family transcriptional regulator [Streptomyces albidoflavus]